MACSPISITNIPHTHIFGALVSAKNMTSFLIPYEHTPVETRTHPSDASSWFLASPWPVRGEHTTCFLKHAHRRKHARSLSVVHTIKFLFLGAAMSLHRCHVCSIITMNALTKRNLTPKANTPSPFRNRVAPFQSEKSCWQLPIGQKLWTFPAEKRHRILAFSCLDAYVLTGTCLWPQWVINAAGVASFVLSNLWAKKKFPERRTAIWRVANELEMQNFQTNLLVWETVSCGSQQALMSERSQSDRLRGRAPARMRTLLHTAKCQHKFANWFSVPASKTHAYHGFTAGACVSCVSAYFAPQPL